MEKFFSSFRLKAFIAGIVSITSYFNQVNAQKIINKNLIGSWEMNFGWNDTVNLNFIDSSTVITKWKTKNGWPEERYSYHVIKLTKDYLLTLSKPPRKDSLSYLIRRVNQNEMRLQFYDPNPAHTNYHPEWKSPDKNPTFLKRLIKKK